MKALHYTNVICFSITLLLYVTIFGGLVAQLFLGGIQVLLAIALFIQYRKLNTASRKRLVIYATITALYLLFAGLWDFINLNIDGNLTIALLVIIPMSLASYFVFITYKISKNEV